MRLVFFGTPEFSVPSLLSLLDSGHDVIAVVTQPDRQKGRGRRVFPSPMKVEAQRHGIAIFQPLKARDGNFIRTLRDMNPEMIIVVAYGQILPPEIIHMPEKGCINLHASLLPKYRGAAPINWAIINGDRITGITTMLMDEGMDTGPILLKKEAEIGEQDTAGSLSERLAHEGASLLIRTVELVAKGKIKPVPQSGEVSYAPALKKSDGLIDWSMPARRLHNFIRGVTPWPGAYTFLNKQRIKITRTDPVDGRGRPGIIEKVGRDEILVGTGEGLLSILELQVEGRHVMDTRSFLQGRRVEIGMNFSSNNLQ
jgi:methionyl-tRNA formyltransferase